MENLRPLLSGVIGAVIAAGLIAWGSRGAEKDLPAGRIRYGRRMRGLSLAMLAVGIFIAYAALHASQSQRVVTFFVAAPLFAGALWFVLETYFVEVTVSATHLTHKSPWRRTRSIPWPAITGYEFSEVNSCHVLTTKGFGSVRLSTYMSGVDEVAEYLSNQPPNDA